jgi:hypothetical protein
MIYRLLLAISIIGIAKQSNAQSTSDIMWSTGVNLFDIENYFIPNMEVGIGVLFYDISDEQSLSVDISPSFWLNYNTAIGWVTFVDLPLMLNYNLGHRITNNYDIKTPIGFFAGLGYEYSYNGFLEFPMGMHGPSAQFGLRFKFWDRGGSYYAKVRMHQPISDPKYDYAVISIGIGQNL